MSTVFLALIAIALASVVGALALGLVSMARGGAFDRRNANRLMRIRVALQATAVALILLAFLVERWS